MNARSTLLATGTLPLLLALLAPAAHAQPSPQATFDDLTYTLRSAGYPPGGHEVTIDGRSGQARLTSAADPGAAPIVATLGSAELSTLDQLVRQAALGSIPDPVTSPTPVGGASFSLSVTHGDGALAGATSGVPGVLGAFSGRLRPLLDALDGLAQRLQSPPSPVGPTVHTGTLRWLAGAGVALLDLGGTTLTLTPASEARRLAPLAGTTVDVEGVRVGPTLRIQRVVNPVHGAIEGDLVLGVVPGASARLELRADGVIPGSLQSIPVRGPLAALLLDNVGRRIRGEGWTRLGAVGGPAVAVVVTEVEAVARVTSWLKPANAVRVVTGARVRIVATRVTSAGRQALVIATGGSGWVHASRLRIDRPASPVVTTAPAGGTAGLVGGVPGE